MDPSCGCREDNGVVVDGDDIKTVSPYDSFLRDAVGGKGVLVVVVVVLLLLFVYACVDPKGETNVSLSPRKKHNDYMKGSAQTLGGFPGV